MNFEELKKSMDEEANKSPQSKIKLEMAYRSGNPMAIIRSNMKKEIIVQLFVILIFMTYPLVVPMPKLSSAVYWVFMFITCVMTIVYLIRLFFFLQKTNHFDRPSKDALQSFISELKITLAVYKSFVIAGSLLLPIPVFAVVTGFDMVNGVYVFERWFLLDITMKEMILAVIIYLVIAVAVYWITQFWTNYIYGRYLSALEKTLLALTDEV